MIGKFKIGKSDNLTLFVIMIATITVMSLFLPEKFLRLVNFQSMASQFPEYGLLALGIMLAMITGGIDLSVVSIANLSGVAGAMVLASCRTVPTLPIPMMPTSFLTVACLSANATTTVLSKLIGRARCFGNILRVWSIPITVICYQTTMH